MRGASVLPLPVQRDVRAQTTPAPAPTVSSASVTRNPDEIEQQRRAELAIAQQQQHERAIRAEAAVTGQYYDDRYMGVQLPVPHAAQQGQLAAGIGAAAATSSDPLSFLGTRAGMLPQGTAHSPYQMATPGMGTQFGVPTALGRAGGEGRPHVMYRVDPLMQMRGRPTREPYVPFGVDVNHHAATELFSPSSGLGVRRSEGELRELARSSHFEPIARNSKKRDRAVVHAKITLARHIAACLADTMRQTNGTAIQLSGVARMFLLLDVLLTEIQWTVAHGPNTRPPNNYTHLAMGGVVVPGEASDVVASRMRVAYQQQRARTWATRQESDSDESGSDQ